MEFDAIWTGGIVPKYQCGLLLPGRQQNGLEVRHIDNILHSITSQEITVFNISRIKKHDYNDSVMEDEMDGKSSTHAK